MPASVDPDACRGAVAGELGRHLAAEPSPPVSAVARTREIAHAYVATLAGELGLDMIQFFDQNLGGVHVPVLCRGPSPSDPSPGRG